MARRLPPPATLVLVLTLLFAGATRATAQTDPVQAGTRTVNVELILDASGSMAEPLADGEPRIDAARRVLHQVIADLPERAGVNVGLRVYGHLGDNTEAGKPISCRASELLVPINGVDKPSLDRQVDVVQPTGWTPIAYALEQAAGEFQAGGESITNAIVLVTDGEETCDPPQRACDAAAALRAANVAVTTHVVGFALTPEQTAQVGCIAEEGGGRLFGADDAPELSGAIGTVLEELEVVPTREPVAPVSAPVPLAEIRTLAYHEITGWDTKANGDCCGAGEQAPLLSDDGQRIAFARAPGSGDPANPNRIFVMNADGTGEREVDAYTSLCFCGALIDISGDGSRVVSSDLIQLRVADATGAGGRELISLTSNEINGVRISADGNTIVFRVYRDAAVRDTDPAEPFQRGIYVVNADGSGLQQIVGPDDIAPILGVPAAEAPFFGGTWGLDVSADGSRIAFAAFTADVDPATGGGFREGLFSVNGDGTGLRRLLGPTFTYVRNGAISGDGATIAYAIGDFGTSYEEAGVIGFDGTGQRKLTDNGAEPPGINLGLPSSERMQLSADGSRLLLGSTGYLFDTAGGATLPLGVSSATVSGDPPPLVVDGLFRASMSADAGRFLYYAFDAAGIYQLAIVDVNPTILGGAPDLTDVAVTPPFVLLAGGSAATITARATTANTDLRVGPRVLRDGRPDAHVGSGPMVDDGTASGDASAGDGVFTTDRLAADCCAEFGPRTIRVKAETEDAAGNRHATAVDVEPFSVRAEAPPAGASPIAAEPTATATATPPATPSPTATATAVAPSRSPVTQAGDWSRWVGEPAPEDCTIEPTTASAFVDALSAAGTNPPAATSLPAEVASEADLPAGVPADLADADGALATLWESTACLNAGDFARLLALFSPSGLDQLAGALMTGGATMTDQELTELETSLGVFFAAPPSPLAPAERARIDEIRDVRTLPDGRVLVVLPGALPGLEGLAFAVLGRTDDRWLIDAIGSIGAVEGGITPVAG